MRQFGLNLIPPPKNLRANAPFKLEDFEILMEAQRSAIENISTIRDAILTRNQANLDVTELTLGLAQAEYYEKKIRSVIDIAAIDIGKTLGDDYPPVTAINPTPVSPKTVNPTRPLSRTSSNQPKTTTLRAETNTGTSEPTLTPANLRDLRRKERADAERHDREEELREQLARSKKPLDFSQTPAAPPQTLQDYNIEARRARQRILDASGNNLTDLQYRKMLQLAANGSPDPDGEEAPPLSPDASPPPSPTKTLRSGREVTAQTPAPRKRKQQQQPEPPPPKRPRTPAIETTFIGRASAMDFFDDDEVIPATPGTIPKDALAAALAELSNSVKAQSSMMSTYFGGRLPNPEPRREPTIRPNPLREFIPTTANGNDLPLPPVDARQALWPHVDKTLTTLIRASELPVDKLHLLIPVDDRASVYEKTDLTISPNGILTQTRPPSDIGKLSKHFPTMGSYLRAFSTWAAIKQAFDDEPDPIFASALHMHVDWIIKLAATTTWNRVLKYELAFFRNHQGSRSFTTWSNLDNSLYVLSGLTPTTGTANNRPDDNNSKAIACFRFNKPTPRGQFPCEERKCKYGHFCNLDSSRCKGSHPAFTCPLGRPNDSPRNSGTSGNSGSGDYDRPYRPHNPNNLPLPNRISGDRRN